MQIGLLAKGMLGSVRSADGRHSHFHIANSSELGCLLQLNLLMPTIHDANDAVRV